jgi:DNA invertase Pin-like site-specific DNA recombinase
MPLFAAYVRVSRKGERDELRSPDFQQHAVRAYAAAQGLDIDWLPPEIDVSGSKGESPRPRRRHRAH